MRELILGGEGLIGSTLAEELRRSGHEVTSLDLKTGFDLRNASKDDFLDADRVWFLAWDTGGAKYIQAQDRQHEMYKHNCELAARVFNILAETRLPFLFVTSQLAGQPNAYGITKLLGEHWTLQVGGRLARLWNTYGWEHPDAKSHVITDLVLAGLRDGKVRCMTDGSEHRRFIYKSDCVKALIRLFDGPLMTADISGPEWLSIRSVAEEVGRQLNVEVEVGTVPGAEQLIDPVNSLPGWSASISLSDGICKVIQDAKTYLALNPNFAKSR